MKCAIARRCGWWFLVLSAVVLFAQNTADAASITLSLPQAADKASSNVEFYAVLRASRTLDAVGQIDALKQFVRAHPTFLPAYFRLYELQIRLGGLAPAADYFSDLAQVSSMRIPSLWMLSRIELSRKNIGNYKALLEKILTVDYSLPSRLIYEYCRATADFPLPDSIVRAMSQENRNRIRAISLSVRGSYGEAIEVFRGMPLSKLKNDPYLLHVLGDAYLHTGGLAVADSIWRIGLSRARELGQRDDESLFLKDVAYIDFAQRRFARAATKLASAQSLAESTLNIVLQAEIHLLRGHVNKLSSDYDAALRDYERGARLARTIRDRILLADCLLAKGLILNVQRRLSEAMEALEQCQQDGNLSGSALLSHCLVKANLYVELGQIALAKRTVSQKLPVAESIGGSRKKRLIAATLGEILDREGKHGEARQAYERVLESLNYASGAQSRSYWLRKISGSYSREGAYASAMLYLDRAIEEAERAGFKDYVTEYRYEQAQVLFKMQDFEASRSRCLEVVTDASALGDTALLASAHLLLGRGELRAGNINDAIRNLRKSISLVENRRRQFSVSALRTSYFSKGSEAYQYLAAAHFEKDTAADIDSALFYIERSRDRSVQEEVLATDGGEMADARYSSLVTRMRGHQRALRLAVSRFSQADLIDSLRNIVEFDHYAVMERRLYLSDTQRVDRRAEIAKAKQPSSRSTYSQPPEFCRILYHLTDNNAFAVVSLQDTTLLVRLDANRIQLQLLVAELVKPFAKFEPKTIDQVIFHADKAYELYRLLLEPVCRRVDLPANLVIVPHGILNALPFEMLLTKQPTLATYKPSDSPTYAGDFLVNSHSIGYAPAFSRFDDEPPSTSRSRSVLLVANPEDNSEQETGPGPEIRASNFWRFEPLVYSAREAKDIVSLFDSSDYIAGGHATKEAVKELAPKHDVLHFATHAFIDTTFEAFSGLALAYGSSSTADGLIMGYEIARMDLSACDLVTLSACETALGRYVAGEGVMGLPRLFLRAGTKSVLMTLWKVEDRFASLLMPDFYRHYNLEGMSKIEAISAAKRTILQAPPALESRIYYQHPLFWATFVLYGDQGNTVDVSRDSWQLGLAVGAVIAIFFLIAALLRKKLC